MDVMSAEDRLIRIFSAWDTLRSGFLSLEEFWDEMMLHDTAVEGMAKCRLAEDEK